MQTGVTDAPRMTVIDHMAEDLDGSRLEETLRSWMEAEDASAFCELLGIGPLALKKRGHMKSAHRALCLELWRLATEHQHMAGHDACAAWLLSLGQASREKVAEMMEVLRLSMPKSGDGVFTPAASAFCALADAEEHDAARLRAVALHIRQAYERLCQCL